MFVMHIGPHKTATTYIQQNLQAAMGHLAAAGWDYPDIGKQDMAAQHDIAHRPALYLDETGAEHRALAQLAETPERNLLLSAEGFRSWDTAQFEKIARILKRDTIDVAYVIRDPIDTFYSHWAEEVKQGVTAGLPARLADNLNDPSDSRLLNPMVDLDRVLAVPGARLHVIPFQVLRARKIDIFAHLCSTVLGLDDVPVGVSKPTNTSYPIELTEFLRLVTRIEAGSQRRIGSDLRHRFMTETTPQERRQLVRLMKSDATDARRVIRFPAEVSWLKRLDTQLRDKLAGLWTLDVEGAAIFSTEDRRYIYYDEFVLWSLAPVREAAEEIHKRIAG